MDLNFILLMRALHNEEQQRYYRRLKRVIRDTSNPLTIPEERFKELYRVNRETAHFLIIEITPFLQQRQRAEIALPNNLIVLCALHFYAQGCYQKSVGQDINMPMSQASVSICIELVTDILNNNFGHAISFPQTRMEKSEQKTMFMRRPNGFPGIIGAIDCTQIRIHSPKIEHEQYPGILFYNRKKFYSINTQCIVGANLKLLAINARYPGSVHDSAIWSTSLIRRHLQNCFKNGDRSSWLLGDSGYPLEPWLMTPVGGRNHDINVANYNRAHRSIRNIVERFNGIFKSKFRCCFAERALHYEPEKAARIINACAILYNICIDRRDYEEIGENMYEDNANDNIHHNAQHLNEGLLIREQIINNYF